MATSHRQTGVSTALGDFDLDEQMAPLVTCLHAAGIDTSYSCQGEPQRYLPPPWLVYRLDAALRAGNDRRAWSAMQAVSHAYHRHMALRRQLVGTALAVPQETAHLLRPLPGAGRLAAPVDAALRPLAQLAAPDAAYLLLPSVAAGERFMALWLSALEATIRDGRAGALGRVAWVRGLESLDRSQVVHRELPGALGWDLDACVAYCTTSFEFRVVAGSARLFAPRFTVRFPHEFLAPLTDAVERQLAGQL